MPSPIRAPELTSSRPDLSKSALLWLLVFTAVGLVFALGLGGQLAPGSPVGQSAAIGGALLLLVPMLFFILKRSGYTQSPPAWFVAHSVCSTAGTVLIFVHVAGGSWLTAPGLVLLALVFLVVQGIWSRGMVSQSISHLFARSASSFNFTEPLQIDRARLAEVVEAKVELLRLLDRDADEALFSPTLQHWVRAPRYSLRYRCLIEEEYRLVGARRRAGLVLQWWRRVHLLVALLFFVGLLAHVIVVLFFAGYAAAEGEAYWWHITAWG